MGDILLPAQSYVVRVPNAIPMCTNEDLIVKLRELAEQFNSGNVAGDPWTHVDAYVYKLMTQEPKLVPSLLFRLWLKFSHHQRSSQEISRKVKRKVVFGLTDSAKEDVATEESEQTTSKS